MCIKVIVVTDSFLFFEGIKEIIREEGEAVLYKDSVFSESENSEFDLLIFDQDNKRRVNYKPIFNTPTLYVRNPMLEGGWYRIVAGAVTYRDKLSEIKKAILVCANGGRYFSESFIRLINVDQPNETTLPDLTKRQTEVLFYIRKGLANKQIAYQLNVCEHTIKTHVSNIFKKFNVESRIELLRKSVNTSALEMR